MVAAPNPEWIAHVKAVRAAKGISYKDALKAASATYRGRKYRSSAGGYSHSWAAVEDFVSILDIVRDAENTKENSADFAIDIEVRLRKYVEDMMSSGSVKTSFKFRVGAAVTDVVGQMFGMSPFFQTAKLYDLGHKLATTNPQILCYHNLVVLLCYAKHIGLTRANFTALRKLALELAKELEGELKAWFRPPVSFAKNTYGKYFQLPKYKMAIETFGSKTKSVTLPLRMTYVNTSDGEQEHLAYFMEQEKAHQSKSSEFTYNI